MKEVFMRRLEIKTDCTVGTQTMSDGVLSIEWE